MGTPVSIAGYNFKTKKECREDTKTRVEALTPGQKIYPSDSDFPFFEGLVRRHPDSYEKMGSGIDYFFYDSPPGFPTRCLNIRRTDGTNIDFSWATCITGKSKSARSVRIDILRQIISEDKTKLKQIAFSQFSNGWGEITCPVTNKDISFENTHADHAEKSFQFLVESFEVENGFKLEELEIVEDCNGISHFKDEKLERHWLECHRKKARITLVSKAANLNRPPFSERILTPAEEQQTFSFDADLGLAPPKEVIRRRRKTYDYEQLEFEF